MLRRYEPVLHEDGLWWVCDGRWQIAGPFTLEVNAWRWIDARRQEAEDSSE